MAPLTMKKAKRPERPRLLVALYGPSMAGKTLLTTQLPGSILLFDAGGRYLEQAGHRDDIFQVYETAKENARIQNITAALAQVMPQSAGEIENIVVDDFTFAFQALIEEVESMPPTGPGSRETKGHKAKVMKNFRRELFGYGKNVVIIYHTHKGGDGRSDEIVERKTMSDIEIGRTDMFTNLTLRVVVDAKSGKHGVVIERNRFGHTGITVWDDSGKWEGFWEKLQAEAYKGLTWDDMHKIASAIPTTFADKPAAWAWGCEQGCFKDVVHAANAMEKLVRENEVDGDDLWAAWVADVQRRKKEVDSTSFADGDQAIAWGVAQGAFYDLAESKAAYQVLRGEKKPTNAKEMFGLWINLVNSMTDAAPEVAPTPTEAAPEAHAVAETPVEPPAPPVVDEEAPALVVAGVPEEEPLEWMRTHLPESAALYIGSIKEAANDKKASPAQVAALHKALTDASGWNGDADDVMRGLNKVGWLSALIAGQASAEIASFPAGSFKILALGIIKEMGGKENPKYNSGDEVKIVKEAAAIVDAAYKAYSVTQ